MRFHYYDPVTVSKRFHKLAAEVTPYKAKDGFVSTEQKIFITQDEIDSFMIKRGSYSERRLRTYSFYLLNEDKKSRTDFIKKQYGTVDKITLFQVLIILMQIMMEKDWFLQEVIMVIRKCQFHYPGIRLQIE